MMNTLQVILTGQPGRWSFAILRNGKPLHAPEEQTDFDTAGKALQIALLHFQQTVRAEREAQQ